MPTKPTPEEVEFLKRAYNFFYDIFEEISDELFWSRDSYYRFNRTRDAFLIYSEILEYEPVGWFLDAIKKLRPPMEAELSKEFLLFVRNVLIHFPFFKQWEDVELNKKLINWSKPGQSIDSFLSKFSGHQQVKYRVWNPKTQTMTYVSINFPKNYNDGATIKLKEFVPEKEGVTFCLSLMQRVLNSQVESVSKPNL